MERCSSRVCQLIYAAVGVKKSAGERRGPWRWGEYIVDERGESAAAELLDQGYTVVKISQIESRAINSAIAAGLRFFQLPAAVKLRFRTADLNHGYRPMGHEYSISADRPDLNECFAVWNDRTDLIPQGPEIAEIADSWADFRRLVADLVESVIAPLAHYFGAPDYPDFESASYLQMNRYSDIHSDRDLLQDMHEDGHMVTVHYANVPGLELVVDGKAQALDPCEDALLVMPGSIMTKLTSDRIKPLYHQVRNLSLSGRNALMYFVNPSLRSPVYPWGLAEGEDLRSLIRSNPATFGLASAPEL